jgi:salicylate hydroxylase
VTSPPPLVVAGAGIGGLTAALCLARAGKRVLLLERAPKIEEVGAGLQISPNAGRILASLGLEPALAKIGLEPHAFNIRRAQDGRLLARLPLEGARERWGAPFRVFHRADLQQALLREAQLGGMISIRTGARVGDVEEGGAGVVLRVNFIDGVKELDAAGLVGADGLRSLVRERLFRSLTDAPRYSGYTAWRALIPTEAAPPALRIRETHLWLGPGAHVVHYPLRDASIISVVAIVQDELASDIGTSPLSLDGAALARAMPFARWSDDLRALLEAGTSFRHWPLFGRPELPHWTRGPVTLLGDAAHPMLPFLAQGAAQAIEDADALGRAFAILGVSVEEAFLAYERARMRRATKVQRLSREQGTYVHLRGAGALARDVAMKMLGGRGMLARNAWLYR